MKGAGLFKKGFLVILFFLALGAFWMGSDRWLLHDQSLHRPGGDSLSINMVRGQNIATTEDVLQEEGNQVGLSRGRKRVRAVMDKKNGENERELARMQKALPDNMWVPKGVKQMYAPEGGRRLAEYIVLGDKVRKGRATCAEKRKFYAYKIKSIQDKIELINYLQQRTMDLGRLNGQTYLSERDLQAGEQAIAELEDRLSRYKKIYFSLNKEE